MSDRRRSPRAHWILLVATLLAMLVLLLVSGVTYGVRGESPQHVAASSAGEPVPADIRNGGPIMDASRPTVPGPAVPDRTVVLTFDDGPSRFTPQVLDVLEKYRVPGTFFVIGKQISSDPAVLRRMARDGDEVGVHTFTHPDLGAVSPARERLEISTTQLAIAAATGYTTDLLRLPFSSVPAALTPPEWRAVQRSGSYRVVFATLDTRDWARPGVASIVSAGTPSGTAGAVVMLHDGGGDRSQTVAALKQLIPSLQARGYRFVTVSHSINAQSAWSQASASERIRGSVVLGAAVLSGWLSSVLRVLFLIVGALALARVVVLFSFARRHAKRPIVEPSAQYAPPVSIIVPAYNEVVGIEACVRSLLASDYPDFEVVVVDDGSTDGTGVLLDSLVLDGLRVIHQANAGKPAALNAGATAARHDILVLVDGDTLFEPGTLHALVAPFADGGAGQGIGAVSGNAKVGNRRGLLGRWQHIEYVIGFNLDRRMFDVLQCMPTVPGAVGAFRRSALDSVGGISGDTLAEDTDVTMALCRAGWRIVYQPTARAWTEAPSTLSQLWRQRYRWCYGTLQSIWKHRRSVIERGSSGRLGRRGIPYLLLFQVGLPLLAPAIDVATLFGLVTGQARTIGLTWLAFLVVQYLGALYAFALDHERRGPLWTLPLQQFVYRQLMYLVVIQSLASALYGASLRWHKLHRIGLRDIAAAE